MKYPYVRLESAQFSIRVTQDNSVILHSFRDNAPALPIPRSITRAIYGSSTAWNYNEYVCYFRKGKFHLHRWKYRGATWEGDWNISLRKYREDDLDPEAWPEDPEDLDWRPVVRSHIPDFDQFVTRIVL